MKPVHLTLLLFSFFLILMVARPLPPGERQAEEEAPYSEEIDRNTFRIHYEILGEDQLELADIRWFERAAEAALKLNNPWFNVLEQTVNDDSVTGVIQLETDPMKAQYDAHEILELHLPEQ